jgi:predicted anti-sigma-YlaC factor YlaD
MQGHCDRARQWASTAVDGELSTFENALLSDHLERCEACRDFNRDVNGLTATLRAAPLVPFEGVVIGRVRRHVRLRLAPAVAAMAIAAVGLGSVLASTQLNRAPGIQPAELAPLPAPADFALNQGRSEKLKNRSFRLLVAGVPSHPGPTLP